jgi:hypothetical protein
MEKYGRAIETVKVVQENGSSQLSKEELKD